MAKPTKTTVQVEEIQGKGNLQSTVESRGIYSYDEARPAYIERPDDLRSNGWMQLSNALEDFDAPLKEYTKKRQEEQMELGIAQAGDIFSQHGTDPTTGNKLAWKEVIEAHPELAGKNPWLEKGYESARLQSLGLDFKAQLQDAYTKSGMVNERDVNKVGQFVTQFEQEFRKAQGLHEYPDKVTLGETFTKAAHEGKTGIFNRHIEDMEKQNLSRTREQYSMLFSKELSGIIDDPNVNFSDPAALEQNITPRLGEAIQRLTREANLNGLPETEVQGMVIKALSAEVVERGWDQGGDELLDAIKELDFGKGRLGDIPEMKEWIANTDDLFVRQQKADEAQRRADEERKESDAYKAAADSIVTMASQGKHVSLETIKATGVQPRYWNELFSKANGMKNNLEQASEKTMTQGLQGSYIQDYFDIANGRKGADFLLANPNKYPKAQTYELMRLIASEDKQADAEKASAMEDGTKRIWTMITKTSDEDMSNLVGAGGQGDPKIQAGFEAVQIYMDEFDGRYQEARKAKPNGEALSRTELNRLRREVERDVLKENPQFKIYADENVPAPGQNGNTPPPPPVTLPVEMKTKPLFGVKEEYQDVKQEFLAAPDKKNTRLGKQLAALNFTAEQAAALLQSQDAIYAAGGVTTMTRDEWWEKARAKAWEKLKATPGAALDVTKAVLGANQGGLKDSMKDTINR